MLAALTVLFASQLTAQTLVAQHSVDDAADTFQNRVRYREAIKQLRAGRLAKFNSLSTQLSEYILHPYLQYNALRNRLSFASTAEVTRFLNRHSDLPVSEILQRRWLKHLGQQRKWQTLKSNYIEGGTTELQCYYLRALYNTANKELALNGIAHIWLEPRSQPKSCDPLFEVWRKSPNFTQALVWQRLGRALKKNQTTLSRYLLRYLSGHRRTAGETFVSVHRNPSQLAKFKTFSPDDATARQIILHGLSRWSRKDAAQAQRAWFRYRATHSFSNQEIDSVNVALAIALANEGTFPEPSEREKYLVADNFEAFAQAAVEHQQWTQVTYWIDRLPIELRQKPQWQYWLARSLSAVIVNSERAKLTYQVLAKKRHYYGFLAAHAIGISGQLNATRQTNTGVSIAQLKRQAGIARALELFAVEDNLNARREWFATLKTLTTAQQIAAAELASQLGFATLAIGTANIAQALDHLHLRFPQPFEPQFRAAAHRNNLPPSFLLAIARQESAMDHRAKSSANARGLMQLIPSTARLVAQRLNQRSPSNEQLYDPSTNVQLGSYHISWLMNRYQQQSALASAAYNAGEHRVDRWIKLATNMPVDVWIETIPFRETRNYVKNVLAFRHVYAQQMGSPRPFLDSHETIVQP